MKRLIISSDWELQPERLDIAEVILKELFSYFGPGDRLVFVGDLWRSYSGIVETCAKKIIGANAKDAWFIVGNHDRELQGANRLSAAFDRSEVFDVPTAFERDGAWYGMLPAPDRSAFGASRQAEGRKARDAALSDALEAAIIALETQIGHENLSRAVLFAHGAASGEELGVGQLASGLTWTIPGERLGRWGKVFLGHCHNPRKLSENTWSIGGISSWTFGERAEQFRALVLDLDSLAVTELPLLRALVPIEMELNASEQVPVEPTGIMAGLEARGVDIQSDIVALKIKARLPQHEMVLVPKADALKDKINAICERKLIDSCIITREVTGLHKARLTTEQSAREMSLEQMLDLYVSATGIEVAPGVVDEAKGRIAKIASYYKPGAGTGGFRPVSIEVHNFRQWGHELVHFDDLEGAVAVTGLNATGKSNLFVEALLVALYKRSPSSTSSIEDELRIGEMRGDVVLCFDVLDTRYRVSRAFERGRGGVSCKSEFVRLEGDEWAPVCESATDVDKRIASLVGSYEYLLATIFRTQRDLGRLILATPAQWHKYMLEAMALERFEPLRKVAANNAENAALRARESQIVIDSLTTQIAADSEILDAQPMDELRERADGMGARITDAQVAKRVIEKERDEHIERREALRGQIKARADIEQRLREAKRALEDIKIEDLGPAPEPYTLPETASDERKAHLEEDLRAVDKRIMDARAAEEDRKAKLGGAERSIKSLEAALTETNKRLEAWQAAKDALPEAECDKTDYGPGMQSNCWYYQAAASPETGKRLMDEAHSYQHKLAEARDDASNLRAGDSASVLAELTARHDALAKQIMEVINHLDNALGRAAEIAAHELKVKAQAQLVEQRAARARDTLALKIQLAGMVDGAEAFSAVLKDIERADNRIAAQEGIINAAQSALGEVARQIAKLETIISRKEELEQRAEDNRMHMAKHSADQAAWQLVADAFHATGIPYLLMERVVGDFERTANEILACTGLTVQVETVTPTKKGEARDSMSIKFSDIRGQHQLSQASGAQGAMLDMGLAASLAIVGSRFWGATPEIYIQDEGWDRFNAAAHDMARELIASIAQRFTRFIYITHVTPLAESADVHIRVEADGGVSRLVA